MKEKWHKVTGIEPHAGEPVDLVKAVYLIGTRHEIFSTYKFPTGSIVIDPHRIVAEQPGVLVHSIGKKVHE
jgi:hypothetical protein